MGRRRADASIPAPPVRGELSADYATLLGEIKERIRTERVRVVLAANEAMVLLYWDIGKAILARQEREGWGAGTIDRLSHDLREAFPDMRGFSPRNLKYMRAFAATWREREIVQEVLAQVTWYHNIALLEKADDERVRLWYAAKAREAGWSRNVLAVQIENRQHERQGNAVTNFPRTLPPSDSDLATQAFKDPSSSPMSEAAGTSPISGQYYSPNGLTISIRASPARPYASLRTTGRAGRTR